MGLQSVCSANLSNVGNIGCMTNNPFTDVKTLAFTPIDFEFATFESIATEADWLTAIKEGNIFILNDIDTYEDQSEETNYYESPTGKRTPRRLGRYKYLYKFIKTLEVHKKLQAFRNKKLRMFTIDSDGNINFYSPDGVKAQGFTLDMINPEKMTTALQDGTPAFTNVSVDLKNSKEWNEYGQTINPTWEAEELESLADVSVEIIGTPTATSLVVGVYYKQGLNPDGSENNLGIKGLTQSDFAILDVSGVEQTAPTSFTDNADGTYSMVFTALETGTIDLVAPIDLSDDTILIKSTGAATITIS